LSFLFASSSLPSRRRVIPVLQNSAGRRCCAYQRQADARAQRWLRTFPSSLKRAEAGRARQLSRLGWGKRSRRSCRLRFRR
jgi:hypothetical protein